MKEIPLTQGKVALVDDEDYERLRSMGRWCFGGRYPRKTKAIINAHGKKTSKAIFMHRVIMRVPERNLFIDHIDGNTLNNQKSNLRICSHKENMSNKNSYKNNTSGFKGVTWNKVCKRWQVAVNGKYVGVFTDKNEAARTYNRVALESHGEFAKLNPI